MTYREAIQKQIEKIEQLYDDASPLRDSAFGNEKESYNKVRYHLREASSVYRNLDDQLIDNRAQMELGFSV